MGIICKPTHVYACACMCQVNVLARITAVLRVILHHIPQSGLHRDLAIMYATATGRAYFRRYTHMRYGNMRDGHDTTTLGIVLKNATSSLLIAKDLACRTQGMVTCECAHVRFWLGQSQSAVLGSATAVSVVREFRTASSNVSCPRVYARAREALKMIIENGRNAAENDSRGGLTALGMSVN